MESLSSVKNTSHSGPRKLIAARIPAAVMVSICLLVGLVCWSYKSTDLQVAASDSWRPGIGEHIFEGARFRPEFAERRAFLLFCGALPLTCLLSLSVIRRVEQSRFLRWSPLLATAISGAGLTYFWIASADDRGLVWSPLSALVVPAVVLTALACVVLVATRRHRTRKGHIIVAELVALSFSVYFACYEISPGWMSVYATAHLEPILFPVLQVLHGRTVLVDTQSMYGLFPHLLEPLFRIVPLTISSFSLVMGTLLFLTLFCVYRFLRLATPGPLTALIAFLGYLLGPFTAINAGYPHYQCYPLRTLFPALVLWLGARYLKQASGARRAILSLACGLAVLWNLDSGIACVGGSIALLCGQSMVHNPLWRDQIRVLGRNLAEFLFILTAVLLLALAYLYLRAGEAPRIRELFAFQAIFYRDGFLMEPMKPLGGWWIIAIVYVWAMTSGSAGLLGSGSKRLSPIYLMLSVLGIGVFAYYQGRSVVPNLYYVAWPAYLVCGLFLGELANQSRRWFLRRKDSWRRADNALQFTQMILMTFALCLLFASASHCRERVGMVFGWSDYRASYHRYKSDWYDRVRPIERVLGTQSGDPPVLVLSARDHLWHLFLQHPSPLTNAGFNHIFRAGEFDEMCRIIENQEAACVVWDETYLQTPMPEIAYSFVSPAEKARLLETLRRRYRVYAISSGPGDLPFSVWIPSDEPAFITRDSHGKVGGRRLTYRPPLSLSATVGETLSNSCDCHSRYVPGCGGSRDKANLTRW
jgi:hypothetical protein